jgi:hypothetical protein
MRSLAISLIAVILVARGIDAQYQSVQPSSAECQAGIDSLQAGSRTQGEWFHVSACGSSGMAALAARLASLGSESDTIYLGQILTPMLYIRDTSIFRASRGIANNPSATPGARIVALTVLLNQYAHGADFVSTRGWGYAVTTARGYDCQMRLFVGPPPYLGYLPSDYLEQMAATLDSVELRTGDNPVVRDIAACARLALRSVPLTVPASAITVTYTCGNRFKATNASTRRANLRYRLQGTTDYRNLSLAGGGEQEFFTLRSGTVEVSQQDTVIATIKNGGTGCS